MAIQVADGFSLQSQKPIDARLQFDTVANMKAYAENSLYNGCFAYVIANKTYYTFDSSNTVDSTTGKWREFSGGGGTDENAYHTGDTAETALADADYFPFYDASASAKRKTLWSNIKSVLKTYFDTLYGTIDSVTSGSTKALTSGAAYTELHSGPYTSIPWFGTCDTAATTNLKQVTLYGTNAASKFALVNGARVVVKFTNTVTAVAPMLVVASTGSKDIKTYDSTGAYVTPSRWWRAGEYVEFMYDGTYWILVDRPGQPGVTAGTNVQITDDGVISAEMPTLGVINRSDIYSTTEKVVGCHTDGRPLYQRTYSGTLTNTTESGVGVETNIASGTTVKEFVDVKGYVIGPAGANLVLPMVNDNDGTNRFIRIVSYPNGMTDASLRNLIVIKNGYLTTGTSTYVVTAKYTKTSDAANSYNYINDGDYSTSEKIIGTWVDNKTLYQKTLSFTVPTCTTDGTEVNTTVNLNTTVKIGWIESSYVKLASGNICSVYQSPIAQKPAALIRTVIRSTDNTTLPNTLAVFNACTALNGLTCYVTLRYTKS